MFTLGAYYQMFEGMMALTRDESMEHIPKDLPMLFVSGKDDPVGGFGKGVEKVFAKYKDAGMQKISMHLYEGCLLYTSESILVQGSTYTFWGKGVSQGHSDAIRRVEGVKNAIQYTVPVEDAVERVRSGSEPQLTTRDKHLRECYVVPEEGADLKKIEEAIKTMPNYFDDYDTTVTFITEEELKENHSKMPHGGFVIRSGETGTDGSKHIIEYSLKLDSNPEFTASVLVCYARAAYRLAKAGETGAKTVFDIAPALLSMKTPEQLRAELL